MRGYSELLDKQKTLSKLVTSTHSTLKKEKCTAPVVISADYLLYEVKYAHSNEPKPTGLLCAFGV